MSLARSLGRWPAPVLGAGLLLAPSGVAHAQTLPSFRAPLPEPPEQLLTSSQPTPPGGALLLRRLFPELADEIAKLPPFLRDTSLKLHLRSFYFNRLNSDDTQNEAWALGTWLAYKSGWLLDTFAVGAVGYTSLPLDAPDDTPGTLLLHPPQDPIVVLGQAYAQLRYKELALLTGYRQLVDEGYLNPNDNRMIPNSFEGVTLTGKVGPIGYNVGYLAAIKLRQEEDFHDMAEAAGVKGENRGLILTRLSAEPLPGLILDAANYYVPDVFNTAYGHVEYTHHLTADLFFKVGMQYTDQRSVGSQFLGDFSTLSIGTGAIVNWRGLKQAPKAGA